MIKIHHKQVSANYIPNKKIFTILSIQINITYNYYVKAKTKAKCEFLNICLIKKKKVFGNKIIFKSADFCNINDYIWKFFNYMSKTGFIKSRNGQRQNKNNITVKK